LFNIKKFLFLFSTGENLSYYVDNAVLAWILKVDQNPSKLHYQITKTKREIDAAHNNPNDIIKYYCVHEKFADANSKLPVNCVLSYSSQMQGFTSRGFVCKREVFYEIIRRFGKSSYAVETIQMCEKFLAASHQYSQYLEKRFMWLNCKLLYISQEKTYIAIKKQLENLLAEQSRLRKIMQTIVKPNEQIINANFPLEQQSNDDNDDGHVVTGCLFAGPITLFAVRFPSV